MDDNFADGIGNINVFGGTVRIELLKIVKLDTDTNAPQFEPSHRLVMPLGGFMQAAERFSALRQKLIESGAVMGTANETPTLEKAKAPKKTAPKTTTATAPKS